MIATVVKIDKDPRDPSFDVPNADRIGNCYELAATYMMSNGGVLVHGEIQGIRMLGPDAPIINHAWVVNEDGSVFEPTLGVLWPSEILFISWHHATEIVRYDQEAACVQMLTTGHYGSWHNS